MGFENLQGSLAKELASVRVSNQEQKGGPRADFWTEPHDFLLGHGSHLVLGS